MYYDPPACQVQGLVEELTNKVGLVQASSRLEQVSNNCKKDCSASGNSHSWYTHTPVRVCAGEGTKY